MSIAGGIENAYYRGQSIGCTALQIFTHSNRQWAMKPLSQDTIENAHEAQKETQITHAMVHASYLINLASTTAETREKSLHTIQMELQNCSELGIDLLVLHPGTNPDQQQGIDLIIQGLNQILAEDTGKTIVLLETMAGQGSQIGSTFEQLAQIKKGIKKKKRVGYCVDTCHIWAAGYDFSTPEGYKRVWKEFDAILGLDELKAIHINDSKKDCDSRVDRHADIGQGTIGLEAFRLLMNDPRLSTIPKILETPGREPEPYENVVVEIIKLLKSLIRLLVLLDSAVKDSKQKS